MAQRKEATNLERERMVGEMLITLRAVDPAHRQMVRDTADYLCGVTIDDQPVRDFTESNQEPFDHVGRNQMRAIVKAITGIPGYAQHLNEERLMALKARLEYFDSRLNLPSHRIPDWELTLQDENALTKPTA